MQTTDLKYQFDQAPRYLWGTAHMLTKGYSRGASKPLLDYVRQKRIPINCGVVYSSRPQIKQYLKEVFEQDKGFCYYVQKVNPRTLLSPLLDYEKVDQLSDELASSYLEDSKKYQWILNSVRKNHEVLRKNKSEPVDLLLLHCPFGDPSHKPYHKVDLLCWKILLDLKASGDLNQVGVSNYSIASLQNLRTNSLEIPKYNEIELSPYVTRTKLLNYCSERFIRVFAYWMVRMGDSKLLLEPVLVDLAHKYKTETSRIIYQWAMQLSPFLYPIVGTLKLQRLKDLEEVKFELTAEELASVSALDRNQSYAARSFAVWDWTLRD